MGDGWCLCLCMHDCTYCLLHACVHVIAMYVCVFVCGGGRWGYGEGLIREEPLGRGASIIMVMLEVSDAEGQGGASMPPPSPPPECGCWTEGPCTLN